MGWLALLALAFVAPSRARAETWPECVVPARPGGGFELTCRLLQAALERRDPMARLRISFLPGGIGAVAYESIVTKRRAEPDTLVAFSSGSLLNLAQGKFSKYSERDVRWVAAIAMDYGAVAVRADAPFRTLRDVVEALRADPRKVTFGIGGTVGGQDWTKAALLARSAGVDPRALRYVSFEGGGDALVALEAGHVQVVPGDLAEAGARQARGAVRVLAVLAERRVPGASEKVPTAREQGYDVTWPTVRGVYVGPKVRDADYERWVKAFDRLLASDEFARAREELGLHPFAATGAALDELVRRSVREYANLSRELGLNQR
jgi:putative tricarboxylic transport membrane protein